MQLTNLALGWSFRETVNLMWIIELCQDLLEFDQMAEF